MFSFCPYLFLFPLYPLPSALRSFTVRGNYEDAGPGGLVRKHDFARAESENWRMSRDEQNGEDEEGGGWRLAGSRRDNERWCPPSPGVNPGISHPHAPQSHGAPPSIILLLLCTFM